MPNKEPGAIRQLFAFVGERNSKMRISILLAVLGEMFGIVPFLMVALLADELYRGTTTIQRVLFFSGIAAICQLIKMLLTWRSSLMSHKISFTILKNIREAITDRMAKVPMGVMLETPTGTFKNLIVDNVAKLEDSMAHFMPELPSNIAAPLCSILLIFILDWRMGLASLITIPLGILSTSVSHTATFHALRDVRKQIVDKLNRMPMGTLLDTPSGQLKDILVDRVEGLETPLAHLLPEMSANVLVPIFIIVYLFVLDWRMALISLITIPVGLLWLRF